MLGYSGYSGYIRINTGFVGLSKWLQSGYKVVTKGEKPMKTDKKGMAEFKIAAAELCDHYCKWPWIWKEEGVEVLVEEICGNCPLVRLEGRMKVE